MKGTVLETQGDVSKIQDSTANILTNISNLEVYLSRLVEKAKTEPEAANTVFGVDQMSEAERKAALRKTTLVRSLGLSTW